MGQRCKLAAPLLMQRHPHCPQREERDKGAGEADHQRAMTAKQAAEAARAARTRTGRRVQRRRR
jgi:hypothetical protein